MRNRDIVLPTVDRFCKKNGFEAHSGAWYRRSSDIVTVVELQKSNYGPGYYLNIALWILTLGDAEYPKERLCHLRTRLSELFGGHDPQIEALLSPSDSMDELERQQQLQDVLDDELLPLLDSVKTLDELRSEHGRLLISRSVIRKEAQELLASEDE